MLQLSICPTTGKVHSPTYYRQQHAALGEDLATLKARHEAIQITLQKMDELPSRSPANVDTATPPALWRIHLFLLTIRSLGILDKDEIDRMDQALLLISLAKLDEELET